MRVSVFLLALAGATPAAAQVYLGLSQAQDAARLADAQAARSRDIAVTNELSVLQSQVQTSQALSDLAALRARPALPTVTPGPNAPPPMIDTSQLATIPDATLAASNARARAAADNRR